MTVSIRKLFPGPGFYADGKVNVRVNFHCFPLTLLLPYFLFSKKLIFHKASIHFLHCVLDEIQREITQAGLYFIESHGDIERSKNLSWKYLALCVVFGV